MNRETDGRLRRFCCPALAKLYGTPTPAKMPLAGQGGAKEKPEREGEAEAGLTLSLRLRAMLEVWHRD
jgi:hypothetical protein